MPGIAPTPAARQFAPRGAAVAPVRTHIQARTPPTHSHMIEAFAFNWGVSSSAGLVIYVPRHGAGPAVERLFVRLAALAPCNT